MHMVTCVYCNERFDRDKEPTVQISARRYAHKECAENNGYEKSQDEKDLEVLENYIKRLFHVPFLNATIRKQLRDYRKEYNYSYTGMMKTLIYWYEIKKNPLDEYSNYGVAIIPHVYAQASQYYYNLYLVKMSNKDKNIQQYKPKVINITISPPRKKREKELKLFDLGDDSDEE